VNYWYHIRAAYAGLLFSRSTAEDLPARNGVWVTCKVRSVLGCRDLLLLTWSPAFNEALPEEARKPTTHAPALAPLLLLAVEIRVELTNKRASGPLTIGQAAP
jgi:hypothetical protein